MVLIVEFGKMMVRIWVLLRERVVLEREVSYWGVAIGLGWVSDAA
jgi:hypothetical protein